ncbi:MAG: phage holin family protein [Solirubrobacteraceae bacterium]|nr:phage holin family protein [Solirubrobacteraceae bacterium]
MSDSNEPQVARALQDISNSVTNLVSEEIALAKAEVTDRVTNLGRGAGIGVAAGVFLFFALIMASHMLAWGIFSLTGGDHVWLGYLLATVFFVILAALSGLVAVKLLKKGAPPVPHMAIAEAKATQQAVADARKNA